MGSPMLSSKRIRICHLNVGGQLHATALRRSQVQCWLAGAARQLGWPDIFVFTESWTAPLETPARLPGYEYYICRRAWKGQGRPHGGILMYVRKQIADAGVTVAADAAGGTLVVELHQFRTAVVGCYFSPHDSALYESGCLTCDPFTCLTDVVLRLMAKGMQPIVLGDMNARVGERWEFDTPAPPIGNALDCCCGPPPATWAQIPRRHSLDKQVNQFGEPCLAMMATCGLVLCNGRAPGDTTGSITCASTRHNEDMSSGSVVDVACVPVSMFTSVESFKVCPRIVDDKGKLMQHAPVALAIAILPTAETAADGAPTSTAARKVPAAAAGVANVRVHAMRPPTGVGEPYAVSMSSPESMQVLSGVQRRVAAGELSTTAAVDSIVSHIREHVPPRARPEGPQARGRWRNHPWWCAELQQARAECHAAQQGATPGEAPTPAAAAARRRYRHLLSMHRGRYEREQVLALLDSYFTKPADFWRLLREGQQSEGPPADLAACTAHIHGVYNGELPGQAPALPAGTTSADLEAARAVLLPAPSAERVANMATLNEPITEGEVTCAIQRLKGRKACDAEGVTAECLTAAARIVQHPQAAPNNAGSASQPQQAAPAGAAAGGKPVKEYVLTPVLTSLYQQVFEHGAPLPEQFAMNTLSLIYKQKGDKSNLASYRGIAVGSRLGKVLESTLYQRLNDKVDELGLRAESQCGFRLQRGTVDATFVLQHLVNKVHAGPDRQTGSRVLYAMFVDFAMAFDVVDRTLLVQLWRSLGLSGRFLDTMCKLYDDVRMLVKQQGRLGEPVRTTRGTKQGSELSPLIFGLFIERLRPLLAERCPGAGPLVGFMRLPELLFADDLTLLVHTLEHMQQLLDALVIFCVLFHMRVNVGKTKALVFRPPGLTAAQAARGCDAWSLQGCNIPIVDSQTFLGLLFTAKQGAALQTAAALAASGRRAMHALLVLLRHRQIDQSAMQCRMFDQLVGSILCYNCPVWAPAVCDGWLGVGCSSDGDQKHCLDRKHNGGDAVHIDFLRAIGGLPPTSQKWITLAEFGRKPLQLRWLALTSRFWGEVRGMEGGRLLRDAMDDNIRLFLHGRDGSSWTACFMRCMLALEVVSAAGLAACETVEDVWRLDITEDRVQTYGTRWYERLWREAAQHPNPRVAPEGMVHMSTYLFYTRGSPEPPREPAPHYNTVFMSAKVKHSLIKVRTGSYPLRVATGRYEAGPERPDGRPGPRGIKREDRACRLCGHATDQDDLQHFMVDCPAYSSIKDDWPSVFGADIAGPAQVLNCANQLALGSAIHCMVKRHCTQQQI